MFPFFSPLGAVARPLILVLVLCRESRPTKKGFQQQNLKKHKGGDTLLSFPYFFGEKLPKTVLDGQKWPLLAKCTAYVWY